MGQMVYLSVRRPDGGNTALELAELEGSRTLVCSSLFRLFSLVNVAEYKLHPGSWIQRNKSIALILGLWSNRKHQWYSHPFFKRSCSGRIKLRRGDFSGLAVGEYAPPYTGA